jgi:glucosylceramidase
MRNLILPVMVLLTVGSNGTYGQNLKDQSGKPTNIQIYQTVKETPDRLTKLEDVVLKDIGQPVEAQTCIFVDPSHTFQTFIGIGGALTDASAEVFAQLPEASQQEFMTSYFDPEKGIGYKFARTNIASCDFSSFTYAYVQEEDSLLTSFKVTHD